MSASTLEHEQKPGSERGFGLVFAAFFAIVAAWPLLDGAPPRIWAAGVALAFAVVAGLAPATLRPLNILWHKFGLLLGRVVAPVVMALVFFVAVTPTALVMRALGKDLLRLKFDPGARSYWIARDPATKSSMRNQF